MLTQSSYSCVLRRPERLITLAGGFNPRTCARLLEFLGKSRVTNDVLLAVLAKRLTENVRSLGSSDTLRSIYGLCKLRFKDEGDRSVGILSSHARRHLGSYSMGDCAQIISSLSRVGVKNKPFVQAVVDRILQHPDALQTLPLRYVSNLMTGIARSGVSYQDKNELWGILSQSLCNKLLLLNPLTPGDIHESVCGLLAYSYANPGPQPFSKNIFTQVSDTLSDFLSESDVHQDDILKYIKACSRVQHRSVPALSACAGCIRKEYLPNILSLETQDLLEIYSSLDKLGVDMPEITHELQANRGVHVNARTGETWFRQKPEKVGKKYGEEKQSLRKRKWTW